MLKDSNRASIIGSSVDILSTGANIKIGSAQIMSVGGKFKQNTRNNSIDSNTSHELNRGDVTWAEH